MQLVLSLQHPVKTRLRCQILTLIRQPRHDLRGRQTGIFRLVTQRHDGFPLRFTQAIDWRRTDRVRASISSHLAFRIQPAPQRTRGQLQFSCCLVTTGTGSHRLLVEFDALLALLDGDQLSSSSSPYKAFSFFRSTNSAAASAKAFSLR